jgi:hypothetical protein
MFSTCDEDAEWLAQAPRWCNPLIDNSPSEQGATLQAERPVEPVSGSDYPN